MKPDPDKLVTVPDAPPVAGPDRALDAPPPEPWPLAAAGRAAVACAAVVELDVIRPAESPITAHIPAAATTVHRRLLFASNRLIVGRRCWGFVDPKSLMMALLLLRLCRCHFTAWVWGRGRDRVEAVWRWLDH